MSESMQTFMARFYGNTELARRAIAKVDAPMLTTTSGQYNAIFGEMAFTQFNNEANAWMSLPKLPYTKSGFRIRTARGFTLGSGGVADAGAVPDTVKSTVVEATMLSKLVPTTFEIGSITDQLDGDDRYTFEEEKKAKAEDHINEIDAELLVDFETAAGDNFESIDRVISSASEESAIGSAGDADIYGLDRSTGDFDAFVDHNSGTDRALTQAIIRSAIATIMQNSGKKPNMVLTGYDTWDTISSLYESQTRYTVTRVTLGVNGVETVDGQDAGISVNAVLGIPVLLDEKVVVDTISRIYFINTDFLKIEISVPTQYVESNNVLDRGIFTRKGMYWTMGELKCTMFSAQGKIRDLL